MRDAWSLRLVRPQLQHSPPTREHRSRPRRRHFRPEVVYLEERCLPSTITGQVFNDLNNNGKQDPGEPGLAGWTVYLDNNGNERFDPGEPSMTTDSNGNYSFTNLGQGSYHVREVVPPGWTQTTGNPFNLDLFNNSNLTIGGINFGNFQVSQTGQAGSSTTVNSSLNPSGPGQPVTFTATVSATPPGTGTPTGTVTFDDGTTNLGSAPLNNGTATLTTTALAAGSHAITGVFGGDTNFSISTSAALTQTVNVGNSVTTVSSLPNPSVLGQAVTFITTVTPVAPAIMTPTGIVTLRDFGATLGTALLNGSGQATFTTTALAASTHAITVVYGGDANFGANISTPLAQTVFQDNTTTTISSLINPVVLGQTAIFTATVSAVAPGGGTPTGTVTFLDSGSTLGTAPLNNGTATFATSALTLGSHAITVVYGGDTNFTTSTSATLTQVVNASSSSITLSTNFPGLDFPNSSQFVPPDPQVAAGPAFLVEVVNSQLAFYTKAGSLVFSQSLGSFFGTGSPLIEPVALYDEQAGRFVVGVLQRDFNAMSSTFFLAVSNSSDPTAGFSEKQAINLQQITSGGQVAVADFPRLGWNADAYVVTFNMYTSFGSTPTYDHTQVLTIAKPSVLDGNPATLTALVVNRANEFALTPAVMHGSLPGGPAGGPMWFVLAGPGGSSTMQVTLMSNPLSGTPTFTDVSVGVPAYGDPPAAPQQGSSALLFTFDTRRLSVALRGNRLLASQTVGTGGVAHARWYEFNIGGTPLLTQSGEINPGAAVYTYYPAIEIAANGGVGMTYLESSTSEFLSMYVTGRTVADPAGSMETPVLAKGGLRGYSDFTGSSPYSVGQYGGISVDPSTGTSFWAAHEYATNAISSNWGTWIADFNLSGSGGWGGPLVINPVINPGVNDTESLAGLLSQLTPAFLSLGGTASSLGSGEDPGQASVTVGPANLLGPTDRGVSLQPRLDLNPQLVDGLFDSRSGQPPSDSLARLGMADAVFDTDLAVPEG